jgi:hypothetical protein
MAHKFTPPSSETVFETSSLRQCQTYRKSFRKGSGVRIGEDADAGMKSADLFPLKKWVHIKGRVLQDSSGVGRHKGHIAPKKPEISESVVFRR